MGIQGLLPFLSNSTRDAQISEFENEYVAIDAYSWLHKGIYSCCVEIAMKNPTTKYVTYCMRYIEMLLHFKVKPILVFDGKRLSSKEETEKKRREERKNKYKKGIELIRAGEINEGRKLLGGSVDVTHELAVNVMKECRKKNIDCIVAPYEADAQLAFLSLNNIVKCVVTEDSDLLVYGCERVFFKMDTSGRGKLIEYKNIHLSLGLDEDQFSKDKFRFMCILSGCDYLPSLPSVGLVNALKFVKMLGDKDIYEMLRRLPVWINKPKITVTSEYVEGFRIADKTFKHQIVYDSFRRKEVPLMPVVNDDDIVGEKLPEDLAFQLALGNIDPITKKKLDNFDPDKFGTGFSVLWIQDFLPNAAPRSSIINSTFKSNDIKKRQREGYENDPVLSSTNDLKKQCSLPQFFSNFKNNNLKQTVNKVSKTAFIFEPSDNNVKKHDSKTVDESGLLHSRYFGVKNSRKQKKIQAPLEKDRRKNETKEEYLQRLYDECFTEQEGEEEKGFEEGFCCKESTDFFNVENLCSSCEKCYKCCLCEISTKNISSTQLDDFSTEIQDKEKKENKIIVKHYLLDEIYKNENGETEEDTTDEPKENENQEEKTENSPEQSFSINFSKLLSTNDGSVCEKVDASETQLLFEKEHNHEVIELDCEKNEIDSAGRSPSPVFKVQKESRVLNNSCKSGIITDTVATPTSFYFPVSDSKSFHKTHSSDSTRRPLIKKAHSAKSFRSAVSKTLKNSSKSSTVHRTLFQFGFKKENKEEN